MDRIHGGVREKCEGKGEAERKYYGLTAMPYPELSGWGRR